MMKHIRAIIMVTVLSLSTHSAFALNKNETAPLFSLRDVNGNYFYLNNYLGEKARTKIKGVIVNFFSTNCEPCKLELPILNKMVPDLEAKGIKVIVIGWNENNENIESMLAGLNVDKPTILSDPYGKTGEKYGLRGLPLTVIINGTGKVHDIMYVALPNYETVLKSKVSTLK